MVICYYFTYGGVPELRVMIQLYLGQGIMVRFLRQALRAKAKPKLCPCLVVGSYLVRQMIFKFLFLE